MIEVLAGLYLVLPGLLPAYAMAGSFPTSLALSPLLGALIAAFAAMGELVIGGTLVVWYPVGIALCQVAAVIVIVSRARRRSRTRARSIAGNGWVWLALALIAGACGWALTGVRGDLVGYDAHAIWVMHAMFVYGGHGTFLADLRNPAYHFTNPDYPPLVPASMAVGFIVSGKVDYHLAVVLLAGLNAAALALLGTGVASVSQRLGSMSARVVAVVAAGALCLAGFGIAGQYAVDGYADLLWAAAAAGAVVYGLMLPRSGSHLAIAWACSTVAALTKNEGLIAAVVVLGLVACRYFPASSPRSGTHATTSVRDRIASLPGVVTWGRRLGVALLTILPGALWAVAVKAYGIGNVFFGAGRTEPVPSRLHTTADRLWAYLHVLPLALVVLVCGVLWLTSSRRALGLANPAWLWTTLVLWLASLVYTYAFGALPIDWWLRTSADRTTIFPQLLLITEMAIWAVVGVDSWLTGRKRSSSSLRATTPSPLPTGGHVVST